MCHDWLPAMHCIRQSAPSLPGHGLLANRTYASASLGAHKQISSQMFHQNNSHIAIPVSTTYLVQTFVAVGLVFTSQQDQPMTSRVNRFLHGALGWSWT